MEFELNKEENTLFDKETGDVLIDTDKKGYINSEIFENGFKVWDNVSDYTSNIFYNDFIVFLDGKKIIYESFFIKEPNFLICYHKDSDLIDIYYIEQITDDNKYFIKNIVVKDLIYSNNTNITALNVFNFPFLLIENGKLKTLINSFNGNIIFTDVDCQRNEINNRFQKKDENNIWMDYFFISDGPSTYSAYHDNKLIFSKTGLDNVQAGIVADKVYMSYKENSTYWTGLYNLTDGKEVAPPADKKYYFEKNNIIEKDSILGDTVYDKDFIRHEEDQVNYFKKTTGFKVVEDKNGITRIYKKEFTKDNIILTFGKDEKVAYFERLISSTTELVPIEIIFNDDSHKVYNFDGSFVGNEIVTTLDSKNYVFKDEKQKPVFFLLTDDSEGNKILVKKDIKDIPNYEPINSNNLGLYIEGLNKIIKRCLLTKDEIVELILKSDGYMRSTTDKKLLKEFCQGVYSNQLITEIEYEELKKVIEGYFKGKAEFTFLKNPTKDLYNLTAKTNKKSLKPYITKKNVQDLFDTKLFNIWSK